jgi:hypothetical protein
MENIGKGCFLVWFVAFLIATNICVINSHKKKSEKFVKYYPCDVKNILVFQLAHGRPCRSEAPSTAHLPHPPPPATTLWSIDAGDTNIFHVQNVWIGAHRGCCIYIKCFFYIYLIYLQYLRIVYGLE